jgi:hypothetical protein
LWLIGSECTQEKRIATRVLRANSALEEEGPFGGHLKLLLTWAGFIVKKPLALLVMKIVC